MQRQHDVVTVIEINHSCLQYPLFSRQIPARALTAGKSGTCVPFIRINGSNYPFCVEKINTRCRDVRKPTKKTQNYSKQHNYSNYVSSYTFKEENSFMTQFNLATAQP